MQIKVGMLISYDYQYAVDSLKFIYEKADKIVLAIDKDFKTWSGGNFEISPSFFEKIKELDSQNKIEIYRDNFYLPKLSTMQNDTRERNMLADFMGRGDGWHIQVDSDEYFVNFSGFVDYLHSIEDAVKGKNVTVWANWITLFKQCDGGFLACGSDAGDFVPIATNVPMYTAARNADSTVRLECAYKVLHQSWARSEGEIESKLSGWSHSEDFDTNVYFQFWKHTNRYNALFVRNFHPLPDIRNAWSSLYFLEGDIYKIIENLTTQEDPNQIFQANQKLLKTAFQNRYIRKINKLLKK